jgi:hypothetical protein
MGWLETGLPTPGPPMERVMEECDSMSSKRPTILMLVLMLLGGGYFIKLHRVGTRGNEVQLWP